MVEGLVFWVFEVDGVGGWVEGDEEQIEKVYATKGVRKKRKEKKKKTYGEGR